MDDSCGNIDNGDQFLNLRIASLFIILVTSTFATLFPVLTKRSKSFKIPDLAYDAAKYFGSGVIIATAFIHLLAPAVEELSSPCLTGTWQEYPWALAISMFGVFGIFFMELFAFRIGTQRLKALGFDHDPHGHGIVGGSHAAHGPEQYSHHLPVVESQSIQSIGDTGNDLGKQAEARGVHHHHHATTNVLDDPIPQIIGVAILEFGVLLHSVLIGLTLAVDPAFKVLFVVIIFHQMFEGLGLGTRLGIMKLPLRYNKVPIMGALLYGIATPIGIAVGLGIRSTYNPGSTTASIVSGIMDSLSSGILLYTGLVELLAHEFLFNPSMQSASNGKVLYASTFVVAGAGIMALLGRWA